MEPGLSGKSSVSGRMMPGQEPEGDSPLRLTDKAYQILEEMIVTLQLAPGSTWSESALCDRIGIGRTPVREALQRLALEQLVQIVPRYGVIVMEVLIPEQIMVVEMLRVLEPLIASRAARRSSVREKIRIAEYRAKLLDTLKGGDISEYLRLHLVMRKFVSECTRNKFLISSLTSVDALSRRFFYMLHQSQPDELVTTGNLYAEVLHAIATDDEVEASAAAIRLVDRLEDFTRSAFKVQY